MLRLAFLTIAWLSSQLAFCHDTEFRCVFTVDKKEMVITLDAKPDLKGEWISKAELRNLAPERVCPSLDRSRDLFKLTSPGDELLKLCYNAFRLQHPPERLYFARLKTTLAVRADDKRCHGHPVAVEDDNQLKQLGHDSTRLLRKRLKHLNFAPVLEGLVYRSGALGKEGLANVFAVLANEGLALPRSIASIHVMGYGGPGGDYNLEEMEVAERLGLTFLYSYAHNLEHMVYMDGTDPSEVDDEDAERGNIYKRKTVDKYIPDPQVRARLLIEESINAGRVIVGNTSDFLMSLENMINAPWPLIIHCKGGRHKTGMFCIILEYLAYRIAMSADETAGVWIPAYKNRLARWWVQQGTFADIFFGGPWYENVQLRPAERHYAEHNRSVFRRKNIEFVRHLVEGSILSTPALREQWQRIEAKFRTKIKEQAAYLEL